jgi:hypothetical protein
MAALTDIWHSERGLIGVALIIACTVLAGIGVVSSDDWLSYTWKIFGIYVGGKSVTGAVQAFVSKGKEEKTDEPS